MTRRLLALAGALALAVAARAGGAPDEGALRQLNAAYLKAFVASDVASFRTLLADDFTGVLADGRPIDKAYFLVLAGRPPDARDLRLHDLVIRQFGDSALVAALVTYSKSDGTQVSTRYASIFARRGNSWAVEWTQWTRVAGRP
ncbi:MAG TPA: nuclear transport factor 2 family protein [Opitutaceae bacterium]